MAALTSLALAAGVGSMAFGAYNMYEGKQQQQAGYNQMQQGSAIQAEAARQQAAISKEQAAASVEFAGRERDINVNASNQALTAAEASRGIQTSVVGQELNIQEMNRRAMELNARRQSLEIIRNQQRGRALALATNVAQGGSGATRGSSALGGAYGQIAGQTGVNALGVDQNLQIGQNIFASNASISNSRIDMANLEYQYAQQQAANQTLKSNLTYDYAVSNAAFTTRLADTQTLMSQGTGMVNMGQGQVGMGNSQYQMGASFFQAGPNIFSMGQSAQQMLPSFSANFLFGGGSPSGYGRY